MLSQKISYYTSYEVQLLVHVSYVCVSHVTFVLETLRQVLVAAAIIVIGVYFVGKVLPGVWSYMCATTWKTRCVLEA